MDVINDLVQFLWLFFINICGFINIYGFLLKNRNTSTYFKTFISANKLSGDSSETLFAIITSLTLRTLLKSFNCKPMQTFKTLMRYAKFFLMPL